MSSDRAFYVTNSIEQAVAHVLLCVPQTDNFGRGPDHYSSLFGGRYSAPRRPPITQSISQLRQ